MATGNGISDESAPIFYREKLKQLLLKLKTNKWILWVEERLVKFGKIVFISKFQLQTVKKKIQTEQ